MKTSRNNPLWQSALVTGAAGGIGRALVQELCRQNLRVLATDRDLAALQKSAADAAWPAGLVQLARLDVTSPDDWAAAIATTEAPTGNLDLLFNVAGIMRAAWVQDTPLEDIDAVLDIDLKGVMLGTRFAAASMIKSGRGHIINVSSMLGLTPGPGMSVYTGAKYGVRGFTLSAALELEAHGVAVTLVCPDKVSTGLFDFPNVHGPQAALAWSGPPALDPQNVARDILRDVLTRKPLIYCLPRHRGLMARCAELAPPAMLREMFAYLASKGARKQREQFYQHAGPIPTPAASGTPPAPPPAQPQTKPVPDNPAPIPAAAPPAAASADATPARCFSNAKAAAASLRASTLTDRLAWIARIQNHLVLHREEIARAIAKEAGKDSFEAMLQELMFVLSAIAYQRRHAKRALRPEKVKGLPFQFGKNYRIQYEPLGIVLILSPYNYPLALGLLPAIEAILAGNAVLLKPSERCPLATVWSDLLAAARLPDGVLQVCQGGPEVATQLIDAGPDRIHLTGGSATGATVAARAAGKLIPVSAELGGKDVALVFEDADLERAIECLVWAFLLHHGQTCASIKRILVHASIYDAFCAAFVARLACLAPAHDHPARLTWESGPFHAAEVETWLTRSLAAGARLLLPAPATPVTPSAAGITSGPLRPVVLADVTPDMPVWQQETWGPLLALAPFQDEAAALAMANDCSFGLGACVWTSSAARGQRVAAALEVGFVSINNALGTMANPALPYGGTKASGWGRVHGRFGLRAFCNIKSVLTDNGHAMEPYWRPYTAEKTRLFSAILHGAFGSGWLGKWSAFKAAGRLSNLMRRSRRPPADSGTPD